jgi:acetoacetyl-CoA synthetase
MTSEALWTPTLEQVESAEVTRFIRRLATRFPSAPRDFTSLYPWSLAEPSAFWSAVWDFCGVVGERGSNTVVENFDDMLRCRWFPDARLNYAENLLNCRDESPALVAWNERGFQRRLSYMDLYDEVAQLSGELVRWGVRPGDRVAGLLPNIPQAVIAMLATAAVGGVWSSCSPDFGLQAVLDRFGQIEPRVLIAVDGYEYDGKRFDLVDRLRGLRKSLPSLSRTVVVPNLDESSADPDDAVTWPDVLSSSSAREIDFRRLPFDHPLYILYTSGTTGLPKCIVHRAGGILLQHLKEHVLHTNLGPDDRLFYFTTCGWMMWNWLVGALATGGTVVLYDGSPLAPDPSVLWRMAEQEGLTVFGTSPRYLSAIEKAGLAPRESHDLTALRTILSTGSPLLGENYDYVYSRIKPDVQLSSISGGTDLCSCFALGNPVGPVYREEIQTRGLGMAVEVFDDDGRPVRGEKGELVCTAPFPSMPLGFWGDDGTKYRQTYFERFPGVWHHGDFAELTEHDGLIIHGRSDTVLNPGGVRIGTAEIYRQLEPFPEIAESLAVAQTWRGDVRIILFVRLQPDTPFDAQLVDRIRREIRKNASPRHLPAKILAVTDIPRTKSGKIVEAAVREVIHGRQLKNTDALANPEALEFFRDRPELAAD